MTDLSEMSHDYELEQSNLKSMAEVLCKELKQQEQQKTNAKAFVAAVKKYTDMQELDAAVLREFIDRIEVSHTDKKSKTREITIVYNFIGTFDFAQAIEEAHDTTEKQQKDGITVELNRLLFQYFLKSPPHLGVIFGI